MKKRLPPADVLIVRGIIYTVKAVLLAAAVFAAMWIPSALCVLFGVG